MSITAALPPQLFNREIYLRRQAAANGPLNEKLREHMASELVERLAVINRSFGKTLLISVCNQPYADRLIATGKFGALQHMAPIVGDDLHLPEEGFDCVISLLDLHAINDVPGHLAQLASALQPDGLAILSFFAGESLRELREAFLAAEQEVMGGASPRVAPMIDLQQAGGLLQRAGLALPVADLERLPLRYGEALTLMRDIKALGYSNALTDRSKALTTPTLLLRAAAKYAEHFADADGKLPATIEIAWAMAWKPHPSQQQPLRPGSATARLADALSASKPAAKCPN